jgi:uncharacterized protein YneF (UPF0154 family)
VIGAKEKKEEVVIKKSPQNLDEEIQINQSSTNSIDTSFAITWVVLSFLAGLLTGASAVYFIFLRSNEKKQKRFNYKNDKELFLKLLPYKDEKEIKEILDKLEAKIYLNQKVELDKKKIKEILIKYNIR